MEKTNPHPALIQGFYVDSISDSLWLFIFNRKEIMRVPVRTTERLTLRSLSDEDIAPLVEAIFSNPEVMLTLPQNPQTLQEQTDCAKEYIQTYTRSWSEHGYGGWAVCSRSDSISPKDQLLGFCGFELGERDGGLPELGFGYSQSCWGIGVGYEAANVAVEWFFRQGEFEAFYACVDSFNSGSIHILEKLGMQYQGDEDLWDSVAKGEGLLPVYLLDREMYLSHREAS